MSLPIVIGAISHPTPEQYVEHVLSTYIDDESSLRSLTPTVTQNSSQNTLPYLSKENLPHLTDTQHRLISIKKECLLRLAETQVKLFNDEVIVSEDFSLLTDNIADFPIGTPILIRQTNFATLYFLYPTYVFESGELIPIKPLYNDIEKVQFIDSIAIKALTALASFLTSKIGGAIGEQFEKLLFPNGKQLTTDQLLDSIKNLVHDANVNQTLAEQSGKINGVIENLKDYLKTNDSNLKPDKDLYNYLQNLKQQSVEIINIVQHKDFQEKGLAIYFLAANIMFVCIQQMCIRDPNAKSPKDSNNYKLVSDKAKEYATATKKLVDNLVTKRIDDIKPVEIEIVSRHDSGHLVITTFYSFIDTFKREKIYSEIVRSPKSEKETKKNVESKRENYIQNRKAEFGWMYSIVNSWEKLISNPLANIDN